MRYAYMFINMFMWSDITLHMYVLCYTAPAGRALLSEGWGWTSLERPAITKLHPGACIFLD